MQFLNKLENYIKEINLCLEKSLENKTGDIYESMRYSLLAGGKRMRPVLSMATSEALSGNVSMALDFGCALEMIHTYSLIHDDLPCMDDDALRRGRPTNHIVFGEAKAVLAGDALLNYACEFLTENCTDPHKTIEALKVLYKSSGADGMIGGQILDINAEVVSPDEKGLELLHRKKTGALINAAVSLGAISAGKEADCLLEYSSSLGLAFQICDDILDVFGDAEKIGKPINSDEKNKKTTFVTLYGAEGARIRLREETEKAISSIDFLGKDGEFLRQYALYLLNREV